MTELLVLLWRLLYEVMTLKRKMVKFSNFRPEPAFHRQPSYFSRFLCYGAVTLRVIGSHMDAYWKRKRKRKLKLYVTIWTHQ